MKLLAIIFKTLIKTDPVFIKFLIKGP